MLQLYMYTVVFVADRVNINLFVAVVVDVVVDVVVVVVVAGRGAVVVVSSGVSSLFYRLFFFFDLDFLPSSFPVSSLCTPSDA